MSTTRQVGLNAGRRDRQKKEVHVVQWAMEFHTAIDLGFGCRPWVLHCSFHVRQVANLVLWDLAQTSQMIGDLEGPHLTGEGHHVVGKNGEIIQRWSDQLVNNYATSNNGSSLFPTWMNLHLCDRYWNVKTTHDSDANFRELCHSDGSERVGGGGGPVCP